MIIAPFGILKSSHQNSRLGLYHPMENFSPSGDYAALIDQWLEQTRNNLWPAWNNGAWVGDAATDMEIQTKTELELAVSLYHGVDGSEDMLKKFPDIPAAQDGQPRDHEWHYKVEDAEMDHHVYSKPSLVKLPEALTNTYEYRVSRNGWANHQLYDPTFDPVQFETLFFRGFIKHSPQLFDIKAYFQRPRPWTSAFALDVQSYRWTTASGFIHTGIHPSLLSGHCIQGIMGGCTVLEAFLDAGVAIDPSRLRAIQKYMVDWGDRRVFAGVHYMTDNIGSWTLARRLIPHLFRHAPEIEALAVEAITQHSQVFSDIVERFPPDSPARAMLLADFPEAVPVS